MTLRMVALVLAAVLAVPAALVLLRPGRAGDDPGEAQGEHRRLDALWAVVPIALLVVLIALSAAA